MAAEYGTLERRLARMLSRFPVLKGLAKQGYARAVYALSGGGRGVRMSGGPVHDVGADDMDTFFGYYDKSPLSSEGWLLCHASRHPSGRPPQPDQEVSVQVYDFGKHQLRQPLLSVQTACYNWQQGARAHWLDEDHFIFNDLDTARQRYISRVVSVSARGEVRRYDHAVQDSWGRDYFLAINYRRLQALRPDYGYCSLPPLGATELSRLDEDGIWRVEQVDGKSKLLYSLHQVCQVDPEPDFTQATHKINHVMIAPDGRHFIFLHRRFIGKRKSDRLLMGAADGSGLRVLSANDMVSHCFWIDDASLLCYLRGPTGHDGYHIVDTRSGVISSLFDGALDSMGDGHPHVHGDWFVTDTYPDKRRMQHLVWGNWRTGQVRHLAHFHHSFRYGGQARCDLHPRIAAGAGWVFFDSVCSGRRRLYFLDPDRQEE